MPLNRPITRLVLAKGLARMGGGEEDMGQAIVPYVRYEGITDDGRIRCMRLAITSPQKPIRGPPSREERNVIPRVAAFGWLLDDQEGSGRETKSSADPCGEKRESCKLSRLKNQNTT